MDQNQIEQIETIYKKYYKLLVTYAYRYLADWNAANDAAQETFRDVCQNPERLLTSGQPVGWLKTACRYVCLCMLRKQKFERKRILSLEELDAESFLPVYDTVFRKELNAIVGIEDPADLELLYRLFVLQESYEDVAQSLKISVGACYKRAERLCKKIRKKHQY